MSGSNDSLKKAFDLWESFKKEIVYNNRFFLNHEVLEFIKNFASRSQKSIEQGTILHRARLYTGDENFLYYLNKQAKHSHEDEHDDNLYNLWIQIHTQTVAAKEESGFWGYNKQDSFVPPNDVINDGRANPAFIKYLYTAEEPYTALVEVRPYLNSKVSVAQIKVNIPLNVADFTYESFAKFEGFEQDLLYLIMSDFSKPSDSDKKSYIPTQYVSEFIKTLGFDGLRFNSSLHAIGRNITIFNYQNCEAIGSKLYEVNDICFEARGLAPKDQSDLIHEKLVTHKQVQFQKFMEAYKRKEINQD